MKIKQLSMLLIATVFWSTQMLLATEITNEATPISEEEIVKPYESEEVEEGVMEDINTHRQEILLTLDSNAVQINGEVYTLTTPPKVVEGRTFLPLRFVVDQVLDASVIWDEATKGVTVSKQQKNVKIQIGSTTAFIDGQPVVIEQAPIIDNNTTLLPIRFMSEVFGLTTSYNQQMRTITVTVPVQEQTMEELQPIATFDFEQDFYIAGQTVKAIDTSYDPNGNHIVETIWMINDDPQLNAPKLEQMFRTPRAGSYKVSLRVKNSLDIWSEWTEQIILILPNEKPRITALDSVKQSYAQGENLAFTYTYENEEWESIATERWTYRRLSESQNQAVIDKPKALFAQGDYVITLQIQDAYGNMSDMKEVIIHITDEVLKSELEYKFNEGQIGDIIDNFKGLNYQSYQEVTPYKEEKVSAILIMSDSPEVVKKTGILYKDILLGQGRLLLHHINDFNDTLEETSSNKNLIVVAENPTNLPINLTVKNKVIKGPTEDSLYLGQILLQDYLKAASYENYTLHPGQKIFLYHSSNKRWLKGQCISGLMDLLADGPIHLTVAAIDEAMTLEDLSDMPFLEKDIHPRGTFNVTDISYDIQLETGIAQKLILGKGTSEWVSGYDAITGELVQNRGNFGVVYRITVTAQEDVGVILNPRANIFRGAVKWKGGEVHLIPTKGFFSGNTTKAAVLGTVKSGQTRTFEYMLPNGSSAPVLIGFIPKSEWNN